MGTRTPGVTEKCRRAGPAKQAALRPPTKENRPGGLRRAGAAGSAGWPSLNARLSPESSVSRPHVLRQALLSPLLPLQHHRHPHPARGADGEEAVLLPAVLQLVADGGDDARAGRAEGMSEGDGAAGAVDLLRVDLADRLGAAELLLGDLLRADPLDVREHLRGEGLV